jgi:hypothetical protein
VRGEIEAVPDSASNGMTQAFDSRQLQRGKLLPGNARSDNVCWKTLGTEVRPFRSLVMLRVFAILAAGMLGVSAFAQGIAITPASPNDTDWITIRFLGGSAIGAPDNPLCGYVNSAYRKVSVANNVLRIELFEEDVLAFPGGDPPYPLPPGDIWAGRLVAGQYRIELHCSTNSGASFQYATGSLTVASSYMTKAQRQNPLANPPHPFTNYSGHWTPIDEMGWGLILQQVDSRQLAVTLFTYGSDTRPVWYFCGGGQWESMFAYRASCTRYQASGFGTPTQGVTASGTGGVNLRFADNSFGIPGGDTVPGLPEDYLVADITAEGRTVSSKRFVRIK